MTKYLRKYLWKYLRLVHVLAPAFPHGVSWWHPCGSNDCDLEASSPPLSLSSTLSKSYIKIIKNNNMKIIKQNVHYRHQVTSDSEFLRMLKLWHSTDTLVSLCLTWYTSRMTPQISPSLRYGGCAGACEADIMGCDLLYSCCSVTQLCLTLCDSIECSTPGFPVLHHLLEFAPTHVYGVGDTV